MAITAVPCRAAGERERSAPERGPRAENSPDDRASGRGIAASNRELDHRPGRPGRAFASAEAIPIPVFDLSQALIWPDDKERQRWRVNVTWDCRRFRRGTYPARF